MNSHPAVPWLVMAAIVVLVLAIVRRRQSTSTPRTSAPTAPIFADAGQFAKDLVSRAPASQDLSDLSRLGSDALGVLFVQQARKEAEHEIAQSFTQAYKDHLKKTVSAPFVVPPLVPSSTQPAASASAQAS